MEKVESILKLNNVEVKYQEVILVLKGVSLEIPEGGIIALLGANGAGKSTTLKAISGLLKVEVGEVTDGSIEFKGERIHKKSAMEISKRGIIQVIEGRKVFQHLTVEENLKVGAHLRKIGSAKEGLEMVYHYFPRLKQKRNEVAGYISGGEQQMTVIGRALMAQPQLMLLDEQYYYTTMDEWTKIFEDVLSNMPERTDTFDCENFAFLTIARVNERYHLNTCAFVLGMGWSHSFCVFVADNGIHTLDPETRGIDKLNVVDFLIMG